MLNFKREQFEEFPQVKAIKEFIVRTHRPARHTEKELQKHRDTEGFYEAARHFFTIKFKKTFYISYDVESFLRERKGVDGAEQDAVGVKITDIQFYDNHQEYEQARRKGGLPALGQN